MSYTLRARRAGYDNIGIGAATGVERTISGDAPPAQKVGGKDNVAVGSAFPTTVVADNQQVSVVTIAGEKVQNQ